MLAGGELAHGAARILGDRGWGLLINKNDSLQALKDIQSETDKLCVMSRDGVRVTMTQLWTTEPDFFCKLKVCPLDERVLFYEDGQLSKFYRRADAQLEFKLPELGNQPLQSLLFGQRALLMELLSGKIFVAKGAHNIGEVVPEEWSGKYPLRRNLAGKQHDAHLRENGVQTRHQYQCEQPLCYPSRAS